MLKNLIVLSNGTEIFSGGGTVNNVRSASFKESTNTGTELTLGSVFSSILDIKIQTPNVAVIVFTCAMVWRTGDTSPLSWLLMGEGGALATWLASYAWKEKAANKSKFAFMFIKEFAAEHGVDQAIQIAQLVLQD